MTSALPRLQRRESVTIDADQTIDGLPAIYFQQVVENIIHSPGRFIPLHWHGSNRI